MKRYSRWVVALLVLAMAAAACSSDDGDTGAGVVDGNLLEDVSRIHQLDTVFKAGIGYDPAQLIEAARGTVGLR